MKSIQAKIEAAIAASGDVAKLVVEFDGERNLWIASICDSECEPISCEFDWETQLIGEGAKIETAVAQLERLCEKDV